VVCHGIPDDGKLLKDGDIVNIDVTVIKDEYHGDTSKMFIVGKPTILGERLCRITQESLYVALRMVKPGIRLRTLGAAIQKFVEAQGFSVVREYCGHGIGRGFHEEPQVLHYDADDGGVVLQPGMTFTIEPMVNAGDYRIRTTLLKGVEMVFDLRAVQRIGRPGGGVFRLSGKRSKRGIHRLLG